MTYEELVQAAKRDPGSVDYAELRLAYRFSPGYDPYGLGVPGGTSHGKIHAALKVGDMVGLLVALSALLEKQFPNILTHQLASAAYQRIGDRAKARMHGKIAHGLLESIFQSGDGQSYQTAFQVITVAEEYAILERLQIKPHAKSMQHSHGLFFEVFYYYPALPAGDAPVDEAGDEGQLRALYFNIDAFQRFVFRPELWAELERKAARRELLRSLGRLLLYSLPLLLCLASPILLEIASGRDLRGVDLTRTILFLASLPLSVTVFALVLLRAKRRRQAQAGEGADIVSGDIPPDRAVQNAGRHEG